VDQAEAHQPGPAGAEAAHRREVGEGQQQRNADQHLHQRDQMRLHTGDALGDHGGDRVEQRGQQGESQPGERAGVGGAHPGDEDETGERDAEPAEGRGGQPLLEQQRAEQHHVERLGVVDDGRERDGRLLVRLEEEHPVEDDEHAAERGERQLLRGEGVVGEVAACQAVGAERERPEQAAEEHDLERGGARLDDEDADGAGEHHGQGEFDGAAPGGVRGGLRGLGCHVCEATSGTPGRSTRQWGVLPMGP
jgi:hypothetical protein